MERDKRASPRVDYQDRTVVYINDQQIVCTGRNISTTGMLILSPLAAPIGKILKLALRIHKTQWLNIEARVVREAEETSATSWGLEFVRVSADVARMLSSYISQQLGLAEKPTAAAPVSRTTAPAAPAREAAVPRAPAAPLLRAPAPAPVQPRPRRSPTAPYAGVARLTGPERRRRTSSSSFPKVDPRSASSPGLPQVNPRSPSSPGLPQVNPRSASSPGLPQVNPRSPSSPGLPRAGAAAPEKEPGIFSRLKERIGSAWFGSEPSPPPREQAEGTAYALGQAGAPTRRSTSGNHPKVAAPPRAAAPATAAKSPPSVNPARSGGQKSLQDVPPHEEVSEVSGLAELSKKDQRLRKLYKAALRDMRTIDPNSREDDPSEE